MVVGHHGIGRYTECLIRGLAKNGHDIYILATSNETEKKFALGEVKGIVKCRFPFAHPLESAELSFKIKENNFDVVHLTSFAVPIRKITNSVVTIHDMIHLHGANLTHRFYYNLVLKR